MGYSLKDIYLGESDGKKEARYKPNFEEFFYDHNGIYHDVMNPQNYLILGRKGTGKSILGEVIKKKASLEADKFCKLCSYKEFKFHELVQLKNTDIKPNEYISIWEWVIYIEFGKLILDDNSISHQDDWKKLKIFFDKNFYSSKLDAMKILEITKQNRFSGSLLKSFTGEHNAIKKFGTGSYLNYLEDLKEVVNSLISVSENKYTLIYDELDDRFRNEEVYKHSIISLLKAADKINLDLYDISPNSKIIILLRTDIFALLNDPDLNKIKRCNGVTIDWGRKNNKDSPLFDLIVNKIRKSISDLDKKTREEIFKEFFPDQKIFKDTSDKYLLSRTFFRPRDIIEYLNIIIRKHPTSKSFDARFFETLDAEYSEYFILESRNELSGYLDDAEIDGFFNLLKQYGKIEFHYNDILEYYQSNSKFYGELDIPRIITQFFDMSIIGNMWYNKFKRQLYYNYKYRDDTATVNFNQKFVIHKGFRKALKLW